MKRNKVVVLGGRLASANKAYNTLKELSTVCLVNKNVSDLQNSVF